MNTRAFLILDTWAVTVCIMDPHGKELPEEPKNLIVRLHKDGKVYRKTGDQLKISRKTAAAVIRRYRMSHSTSNKSHRGRPPEMMHAKSSFEKQTDKGFIHGTRVINGNQSSCDSSDNAKNKHCITSTSMASNKTKQKTLIVLWPKTARLNVAN